VTGLICAGGRQDHDWSADYRLFARDKWEADELFVPVVRGALNMLPETAPLVAALDDTRLLKSGGACGTGAWARPRSARTLPPLTPGPQPQSLRQRGGEESLSTEVPGEQSIYLRA
jgi:hypothetical protein